MPSRKSWHVPNNPMAVSGAPSASRYFGMKRFHRFSPSASRNTAPETATMLRSRPRYRDHVLDSIMKLVFHLAHEPATATTPPPDRAAADPVEPSRPRVAAAAVAGRGGPQALRLSAARHARALRGLPVARAGDPAGRGRRHADPRPADREPQPRRGAPALPRAARPGLSPARGAVPQGAPEARQETEDDPAPRRGGAGSHLQGPPTDS